MTSSSSDRSVLEDMKQREVLVKRSLHAADAIRFEERRFRVVLIVLGGALAAGLSALVIHVSESTVPRGDRRVLAQIALVVLTASLVALLVHWALGTGAGRRLIARRKARLRGKYSQDLHAGRRWLQFFYGGEDISPYVPQILNFIEQQHRFDSVSEALAFAKQHRRDSARLDAHALTRFTAVAAGTNVVAVSSTDEHGVPSVRAMRFVRSDRPGVWFMTTAPFGPKVHEFDLGRIAVVTERTAAGATITSNNVSIRRSELDFAGVADLFAHQVPGYVDGMSEDEARREIVYEVTFHSARVDTWTDHLVVDFDRLSQGE